jgi:aconitate hydratase
MGTVKPCLAGPRRPQDQLFLNEVSENFCETMRQTFIRKKEGGTDLARDPAYLRWIGEGGAPVEETEAQVARETEKVGPVEKDFRVTHGSVVIASITSCTNTSNPSVLIGAGLLAKKAIERGLKVKPFVKTSLSPGSRVATEYLGAAGLLLWASTRWDTVVRPV